MSPDTIFGFLKIVDCFLDSCSDLKIILIVHDITEFVYKISMHDVLILTNPDYHLPES